MATRMQQRKGTAAQWTGANPVLNAGEIGWESDTNKFKIGDGTNHWADLDYFADINSTANPAFGSSITFEGATANDFETTLTVTDPTADRTLTLPDATDTLVGRATTDTLTNKSISLGSNTITGTFAEFNTAVTDHDLVSLTSTSILSNKTLASAVATTAFTLNATAELRLADTDSTHYVGFKSPGTVTSNKIWTLPDADGTANQVLKTDGSGTLSWATAGGGGAAFSEFMLIGA